MELHHEYPIAYRHNNVLTHGIIDRLVLIIQDEQVIGADLIDFKTDHLAKSDRRGLNELGQYYQPQLAAYQTAIQPAFSLNLAAVSARLVFIEAGLEWQLSSNAL